MKKTIFFIACVILLACVCTGCAKTYKASVCVGEYDVSTLGGDFGGGEAYAIGANSKGKAIFKDADKAFDQALQDYSAGFAAVQREYNLEPVSKKDYRKYSTYGWQIYKCSEEEKKQGLLISSFFDIYENSFEY